MGRPLGILRCSCPKSAQSDFETNCSWQGHFCSGKASGFMGPLNEIRHLIFKGDAEPCHGVSTIELFPGMPPLIFFLSMLFFPVKFCGLELVGYPFSLSLICMYCVLREFRVPVPRKQIWGGGDHLFLLWRYTSSRCICFHEITLQGNQRWHFHPPGEMKECFQGKIIILEERQGERKQMGKDTKSSVDMCSERFQSAPSPLGEDFSLLGTF